MSWCGKRDALHSGKNVGSLKAGKLEHWPSLDLPGATEEANFQQHLEPETWEMLLKTYSGASEDHTWDALGAMCSLFGITAIMVAKRCGFDYPQGDDEKISAYLKHVRSLPRDAKTIY